MPLYLSRDRLNANDQQAAAASTADLVQDITQRWQEAQQPEPPTYALQSPWELGVSDAMSPVMSAIGAVGQRVRAAVQPAMEWALPSEESLGVTAAQPEPTAAPQIPGPDLGPGGSPIRTGAEMDAERGVPDTSTWRGGGSPTATPPAGGAIDNSSRQAFVRSAWPYMLEAAGGDQNLAEWMLAKAISENGDVGKGGGFIGNNFSGIKGTGSAGSFTADTWEMENGVRVPQKAQFAAYNTPQEGMAAFMGFLRENPRYGPALENYQRTRDPRQLFQEINAAGYATNPLWWQDVENIHANQVAPITRGASQTAGQPAGIPSSAGPGAPSAGAGSPLDEARAATGGAQDVMLRGPLGPEDQPIDGGAPMPAPPARDDWRTQEPGYTVPAAGDAGVAGAPISDSGLPAVPSQASVEEDSPYRSAPLSPDVQAASGGPFPEDQYTEVETRPRQPAPHSASSGHAPVAEQPETFGQAAPWPTLPGLQPILDAGGKVVAWVQEQVTQGASEPTAEERAQNASVAGMEPTQTLTGLPVTPVRTNTRPTVEAMPGEPDYVPPNLQLTGEGGILEPAGGGPRITARMDEIASLASQSMGVTDPNERLTRRAVRDPAWRAKNPTLAAEYDDLENQLGLVVAGQAGDAGRFGRGVRLTVEVIQERLAAARQAVQRAREAGDVATERTASDQMWTLTDQLTDAINARRAAEPAIRSDVGRQANPLTMTEESADDLTDAMRPREAVRTAPDELSGPVSIPTDPASRLNVTPGVGPSGQIMTDVSNSIGGGVFGAAAGAAANPDDPVGGGLTGAGIGMVGGPAAGRLLPRGGGALGTMGIGPDASKPVRQAAMPGMGDELVPPLQRGPNVVPPSERTSLLPTNSLTTPRAIVENVIRQEQAQARRLAVQAATTPNAAQAGQVPMPGVADPPSLRQRILEAVAPWERRLDIIRYAGMLSDSAAHVINSGGGALMQAANIAATPIAAALDVGRVGVARAVGGPIGRRLGTEREVFFSEIPARVAGMRGGGSIGLQNAREVMRTGLRPEDAAKQLDRESAGFASGNAAVDFAFEAPLRALAAADAVFRTMAQGGHLAAEGMAAAMKAAPGQKITADMLREAMKDPALLERVQKLAAKDVLQEERRLTTWYRNMLKGAPPEVRIPLSVEIPFVRTPYNIVAQGAGLTPAGLLGVVQDMAEGKPARAIEYRVARVALGTAVMAAAAADYAAGNLTGPRPTDEKEISTLPPGWQPWSRKVVAPAALGGGTYYIPLAVMGPFAVPPVAAILMGEASKKGGDMTARAGRVALGIGQYAAQNTFFEGLTNMGQILDTRQDAGKNIERHVEQIASQFSPHIIGGGAVGREIQQIMGMPARDPDGALEALLATHPATAGQVKPRQDVLGRPVVTNAGGPIRVVARAGKENDAGVIRAFRAAKEGLPLSPPKQIKDPGTDQMRTLTPLQQQRWRRVFGAALREDWNNYGNPTDAETLREIETGARKAAGETVLGLR